MIHFLKQNFCKFLCLLLLATGSILEGSHSVAMEGEEKKSSPLSSPINIKELQSNKALLREIASYIFNRSHDIQYIQDKICTHSPDLFEIWKDNKWQNISKEKRTQITDHLKNTFKINESQTNRLLRRDQFYLLNRDIIADYARVGNKIINYAKDEDVKLYESRGSNRWIIEILMDFQEAPIGALYERSKLGNPIPTNTINLTFDVDDIVRKILTHGPRGWDKDKDGYASTMCAALRD